MADCPIVAVALGCIFGTIGIIVLVVGLIILVRWRKIKIEERKPAIVSARRLSFAASLDGLHNEAFETADPNVIMMMSTTTAKSRKKLSKKQRNSMGRAASSESLNANNNADIVEVQLASKDVAGFGFEIRGNNTDGISIDKVHDRGPAKESKMIEKGDKILSMTISFTNMVYEDALTLISYSTPYPVLIQLAKKKSATLGRYKSSDSTTSGHNQELNVNTTLHEDEEVFSDSQHEGDMEGVVGSDNGMIGSEVGETESEVGVAGNGAIKVNGTVITEGNVAAGVSKDETAREEVVSGKVELGESGQNSMTATLDDADQQDSEGEDDTQHRAPAHLPVNIRNLVESKRAASQAVNNVNLHHHQSKKDLLSPDAQKALNSLLGLEDQAQSERPVQSNKINSGESGHAGEHTIPPNSQSTEEHNSETTNRTPSKDQLNHFFTQLMENSSIFKDLPAYNFAFSCESLNGASLFQAQGTVPNLTYNNRPFMGMQSMGIVSKKRSPNQTTASNPHRPNKSSRYKGKPQHASRRKRINEISSHQRNSVDFGEPSKISERSTSNYPSESPAVISQGQSMSVDDIANKLEPSGIDDLKVSPRVVLPEKPPPLFPLQHTLPNGTDEGSYSPGYNEFGFIPWGSSVESLTTSRPIKSRDSNFTIQSHGKDRLQHSLSNNNTLRTNGRKISTRGQGSNKGTDNDYQFYSYTSPFLDYDSSYSQSGHGGTASVKSQSRSTTHSIASVHTIVDYAPPPLEYSEPIEGRTEQAPPILRERLTITSCSGNITTS